MSEKALLDGDHAEGAARAGLVQPGAFDVGNTSPLEGIEQGRRPQETALEQMGVGWFLTRRAGQDRIVAVIDAFDPDEGLLPGLAGVIAVPFAERTFEGGLIGG